MEPKSLCTYDRHLFASRHAFIQRYNEEILLEEERVCHCRRANYIGHNTNTEEVVTLILTGGAIYI
jgi:hypothetical protein